MAVARKAMVVMALLALWVLYAPWWRREEGTAIVWLKQKAGACEKSGERLVRCKA